MSKILPSSNSASLADIICDDLKIPKKDFFLRRKIFKKVAHATSYGFESLANRKICKN